VTAAAGALLTWPEERVWSWWTGTEADAARAWRAAGRTGEDVAALVTVGLDPDDLAALTGLGLTEEQAIRWTAAVQEPGPGGAERIRAWLALGMPADPPDDPGRVLMGRPADAGPWFAAGFALDDVGLLRGVGVDEAVAWRAHGIPPAEVARLRDADTALTVAEAAAFDATGIAPVDRLRWVEDGFDAAAARAWTDLGVLPGEARVWRSRGLGPADARPHVTASGDPLPSDLDVGWFAYGPDRGSRRYGVTDPPGTRGRTPYPS
jgi:hypothetical protein